MRWPGFVGPTYTLRSPYMSADRCVNLYPELNELHNAKNGEIGTLIGRPGLRKLATIGSGPIRACRATSTGGFLVVSGNAVYNVTSAWVGTQVGVLNTNAGAVQISDNGQQAMFVDGANGYILSLSTGVFAIISSAGFNGADTVTFQDGYFIINNPGTGQFGLSALYDGTSWNGLDFATAEGDPDNLVACVDNNRQLWLLGKNTTEVWWNTGNNDFPFSRIDGVFVQIGCGAAQTAIRFGNNVAWLSDKGYVYIASGYQPVRISNLSVEYAISQVSDYSKAFAWAYADGGHWFYCLNVPGLSATWVFDTLTQQWHERTYTDSNGLEYLWRPSCYAFAYSTHVVGDNSDGRIYALDPAVYSDDGSTITARRIPPHLSADLNRIYISQLQLDMQPGVGLDGTGQGTDPQVMLRTSRDGGFTWGNELWRTAGKIGKTKTRVVWRRCGQARDWLCEVKITDPVKRVILGMEIILETGTP